MRVVSNFINRIAAKSLPPRSKKCFKNPISGVSTPTVLFFQEVTHGENKGELLGNALCSPAVHFIHKVTRGCNNGELLGSIS